MSFLYVSNKIRGKLKINPIHSCASENEVPTNLLSQRGERANQSKLQNTISRNKK